MRWKWILGTVAALIIGLVVAVYIIISTYDFNRLKPTVIKAAKDATGRELTLVGDIRLKFGWTPALFAENISFQNAPWGSRPEMAKIRRFELEVALWPLIFGEIDVQRLVLIEPDILIEADKKGRSNLQFEAPSKPEVDKKPPEEKKTIEKDHLPLVMVKEMRIEKGQVVYRDGASGRAYTATIEDLRVSAEGLDDPTKIEFKGSYNGEAIEASGTLGPMSAWVIPQKAWPLDFSAKAAETIFNVNGRIQNLRAFRGLELNFSARGKDVGKLQALVGKPIPLKGPFDVSGLLTDPAFKVFKIANLKVILGESEFKGMVEVNLTQEHPQLSIQGSSQKLDLKGILSEEPDKEKKPAAPEAKKEKVFPNNPLPLDALKALDATVQFQSTQLQLPQLSLRDLDLDIALKDGHLMGKKVRAVVSGGLIEGRLDLHAQGKNPILTVAMKIQQMDVGRLQQDLKTTEALDGKMDLDLDISTRGDSIAAWMGGMNGRIAFVMGKGKISNRYIELLGADLSSSLLRLLNPAQEKSDFSIINCLVVGLAIREGLAKTTALVMDTPYTAVVGEGDINLRTEGLRMSIKPVPKEGIAKSKISLSLGELAKSFKLGGTLAHPRLALDPTQAAITVGKAVGGALLLGPAGIAAALVQPTAGVENPCLTAVETARTGKPMEKKGPAEKMEEDIIDIGRGLKKLFGN